MFQVYSLKCKNILFKCISFAQLGAAVPQLFMNKLGVAPSRPLCHVFANCLRLYTRPNPQATVYLVVLLPCPVILCKLPSQGLYLPRGQEWGTGLLCLFLIPLVWSTQGFVCSACVCFLDLLKVVYISLFLCLPFHCFEGFQRKCGGVNHSLKTTFW